MQAKEWQKLNLPETSSFIEFPLAFTGKKKGGKATVFTGLLLSCQFILAIIHTMNKAFREPAKLTYDYFVDNFGMSRETVSNALAELVKRGIIERVKQSRYKIIARYNKRNYVEVDTYMFLQEWEISGNYKRLTYSRLLTLAFLKRSNENPKTGGVFVSSQERIGKAVGLPRTTAGDSIRELIAADLSRSEKPDGNDLRRRGCSLFTVNPDILAVKHPERLNGDTVNKQEYNADVLHKRLMLDTEYKDIIERVSENYSAWLGALLKPGGEAKPEILELEGKQETLRAELEGYFDKHHIRREFFPPGYFKCGWREEEQKKEA